MIVITQNGVFCPVVELPKVDVELGIGGRDDDQFRFERAQDHTPELVQDLGVQVFDTVFFRQKEKKSDVK